MQPYAGDTAHNEAVAERLCRKVIQASHAPFAPHLLYPRFLNDGDLSARELGISCGLAFADWPSWRSATRYGSTRQTGSPAAWAGTS